MTYIRIRDLRKLSRQYHNCILNHVCKGRQVHSKPPDPDQRLEAAYFDFDGDTIVDLAQSRQQDFGIDMV
ncbi:MAG: alpha-galactosidase [Eubacterium ramulus]